ncbi:MAG: hypothetical protein O3C63_02980 [Cyanobacteria bacterium]|nr:hypothetical protein [Cyanobacteriota bacterium]MDA1020030.1 hypothetical protein [Cyanobacteriota bacterium]
MDIKKLRFGLLTKALQEVLPLVKIDCAGFVLSERADESLNRLALEMVTQYIKQTDERFWQVYWALLDQAEEEHSEFCYNPGFEKEHMAFAISNAFFYYLSTIAFIPKLYKQKYSREIDPADYRKAAGNILVLGYQLSRFHFDVFRAFIFATSKTNAGLSPKLHLFDTECFDFEDDLVLCLSTKVKTLIKVEISKLEAKGRLRVDQPTIGCPGLFVKDEQGRDMISILHNQVLDCLVELSFFESCAGLFTDTLKRSFKSGP